LDDQPEAPKANIRSTIALVHRYVEDSARQVERTRSPPENRCPGRYIEDIARTAEENASSTKKNSPAVYVDDALFRARDKCRYVRMQIS